VSAPVQETLRKGPGHEVQGRGALGLKASMRDLTPKHNPKSSPPLRRLVERVWDSARQV
jgi:hypothetical protein